MRLLKTFATDIPAKVLKKGAIITLIIVVIIKKSRVIAIVFH